jgi:hypothetical protein
MVGSTVVKGVGHGGHKTQNPSPKTVLHGPKLVVPET